MIKLTTYLLSFILTSLLYAQDCNYNVNINSFAATLTTSPQVEAHTLTLSRPTNSSTANCQNFRVYAGKGGANNYDRKAFFGPHFVSYNIYSQVNLGNIVKDYPDAGPGEFLEGSVVQPNVNETIELYFSLPDIKSIFSTPAGVYTDVVPINIYRVRANGDIEFQTARFVTISIQIPRHAELSLVPQNAPHDPQSTVYTMDFGTLQSHSEMAADLMIVGNVGFSVLMSSQNGSSLTNNQDHVPYQIRVGQDSFFSLSPAGSTFQVAMRHTGTNLQGQRYPLRVRLGNVPSNLSTGTYQDVITITVQAW